MSDFRWCRAAVAVVLGAGLHRDGAAAEATQLRANAAARLARSLPSIRYVIASGKGPFGEQFPTTEAAAMAAILKDAGVAPERILVEDDSVDTVGNAVLVAARYLRHMRPGTLYLVTSPFHIERATFMFRHVLDVRWRIIPVASAVAADDTVRGANEQEGIAWAERFFAGIAPGDLPRIIERLQAQRSHYPTVTWLNELRFSRCPLAGLWHRIRCLFSNPRNRTIRNAGGR